MAILCLSPDKQLAGRLAFCGDIVRISRSGLDRLAPKVTGGSEVLIIDLKYENMPEPIETDLPIVALTEVPNFTEAVALLQKGGRGYGNRHMRAENLAQAIESVKNGQAWLPPDILAQFIANVSTSIPSPTHSPLLDWLSSREQEVACYVAEGLTNQQIAERLFVSLRTVKAHLSSIYEKTGMRNRLELGLRLKDGG